MFTCKLCGSCKACDGKNILHIKYIKTYRTKLAFLQDNVHFFFFHQSSDKQNNIYKIIVFGIFQPVEKI